MKKVFYYAPFIETIAKNSERLGANAVTKMWEEGSDLKAELKVYGQTIQEALEKLERTMASTETTETIKLEMDYYLCGQGIVDAIKPQLVSKSVRWISDDERAFIAWLNFEEAEAYQEANPEIDKFWCRQCVPGTMEDDKISLRRLKRENFFQVVEEELNLTADYNLAMVAYNIARREGLTPVQFFNAIKS